MKFNRLGSCAINRLGGRNAIANCFYSTTTTTTSQGYTRKPWKEPPWRELYRRISPIGDPRVSIVPVLDQWVQEGRSVEKDQLLNFIRELRHYKRYSHALECTEWEEMAEEKELTTLENDVVVNDDEPPMLSEHTLAALKEFLEQQQNHSTVDQSAEEEEEETATKVTLVAEDWRLSQFWYDPLTAETVANEVIGLLTTTSAAAAACIACPTLYAYIKKFNANVNVKLLEYDKRFEQYGSDFVFYDYNEPEDLPSNLKHAFRVVVADPPYLSKECLEKVAQTISFLARPGESHLLLLTGEVQKDRAAELLGLHPCGFRPQHSSKLGNEFRLFTNYDPGMRLGGWELEK